MSMTVTLKLIEGWLREHSLPTAESLQPQATPQQLREAARILNVELPTDLSDLYLWHDGANATGASFEIAPTFPFISLERALDAWASRSLLSSTHGARDPAFDWQPHWLPIGSDICGGHIVVETGGDSPGRVFECSFLDGARFDQAWPSLSDWAEDILGSLTTDRPFLSRWRPDLTSPILVWRGDEGFPRGT